MTVTDLRLPAEYRPNSRYGVQMGGAEYVDGNVLELLDPSTGKVWAEVTQATPDQVDRAVATAQDAFRVWRCRSMTDRQELLWRIADALVADTDRWANLLAAENGRPIREAYVADVPTAAAIFRYFSGALRALRGEQYPMDDGTSLAYATREPLGVIAAVIPWNSPLITLANKVAPALAAGNTVVLKPSELASLSVLEFGRLAQEILPPGVVNVLPGEGPEIGAALIAHPDVAKVTFTGGPSAAREILSAAGRALTPAIMELGGKGALIVHADADLEAAADDAITGIFTANGEVCVAASRLVVHASVHDEFKDLFLERARDLVVGDALAMTTEFGPLVSWQHRENVAGAVEAAVASGARVVLGGERIELPGELAGGFYYAPTLLEDPEGRARSSHEEVFGPVTVLERFTEESDAVARVNASRYGLASGVHTRDLARAHRTARALDCGIVWINKWFDLPVGVPMGGVKDSGFGRELSAETLHEYSSLKVVNVGLDADDKREV